MLEDLFKQCCCSSLETIVDVTLCALTDLHRSIIIDSSPSIGQHLRRWQNRLIAVSVNCEIWRPAQ